MDLDSNTPVSPASESRLSPIADDESRSDFDDGSSYSLHSSCEDLQREMIEDTSKMLVGVSREDRVEKIERLKS